VDTVHGFLRGAPEDLLFEQLHLFGEGFEDVEVVVHDGVHEGVRQIVCTPTPNSPALSTNPVAYPLPNIPCPFLEREHVTLSKHDTDLLVLYAQSRGIQRQHTEDDEEVIFIFLDFRPLPRMNQIFLNQRMKLEG
jgi:hypothetical protein